MIGAGFAGASVAAALTRAGVTSGLVVEREPLPGSHASGRNAAMARQLEEDRRADPGGADSSERPIVGVLSRTWPALRLSQRSGNALGRDNERLGLRRGNP